jgi:hypothetical protein
MNNNELMDISKIIEMVQKFVECTKNGFPIGKCHRRKFAGLELNLRNYGSFKKPKKQNLVYRNQNLEVDVLLSSQENHWTSIRQDNRRK